MTWWPKLPALVLSLSLLSGCGTMTRIVSPESGTLKSEIDRAVCESFEPISYSCSAGGENGLTTCTAQFEEGPDNQADTPQTVQQVARHNAALNTFDCGEGK